ncbi:MAG: response regulator [Acidobacteria bacterium]|nr:response regulator [Acidobacteriota bacterium]
MSIPKRSKPKQTLKSVQILHLEDNKLDRELIQVMLEDSGLVCRITAVETRQDYVKQIAKKEWDVILSDYSLPAFDGFEALKIAAKDCPTAPAIKY